MLSAKLSIQIKLIFFYQKKIPGSDVILPFTFIADEAFPLGTHIMRAYAITHRTFGNAERIFNYRLSRARRVIENTFEIMTSRWTYTKEGSVLCIRNSRRYCQSNYVPL